MKETKNKEWNVIGEMPILNVKKPENDITKKSGIYKIINKINGKYYIGSSKNIHLRWYYHKYFLAKNKHKNQHLQNAWNKYSENSFEFLIIEPTSANKLLITEQKWLDIAKKEQNQCYNIYFDATGGELSETAKQKISAKNKGINNGFYGKNHSSESLNIMKEKRKLKRGILAPHYGHKHSNKTIELYKTKRKGILNPSYDPTIYTLINEVLNSKIEDTLYNLKNIHKFHKKSISQLINGKIKTYKGWKCLNVK